MKTLNDKIIMSILVPTVTKDNYATYSIMEGTYDNVIFTGLVFVKACTTSLTIKLDITDILKNRYERLNILEEYDVDAPKLIRKYYLKIINRCYTVGEVYLGYKYPFANFSMDHIIGDASCNVKTEHFSMMLQGATYSESAVADQSYIKYPRYPFIATDKLNYVLLFNLGSSYDDIEIGLEENYDFEVAGGFNRNSFLDNLSFSLSDLLDGMTYKKNISSRSDVNEKTIVEGKKLWQIKVCGQNIWDDADVILFAKHYGYDAYYMEHFFIQQPTEEEIYFIAETNDPDTDILDVWDDIAPDYVMDYSEISVCNNYELVYSLKSTIMTSTVYNDFCIFMKLVCPWMTPQYIQNVLGIKPNKQLAANVTIRTPYLVFNLDQVSSNFKKYFEEYEGIGTYTYEDFFYTGATYSTANKYNTTYKSYSIYTPIKIGELDKCPAKFYLQWFDRYGGVQCLPFDGKATKSINYAITNITNQYDEKRPAIYSNTYNFDINTGWLNEKEYLLYESILVSPTLKLYDTENDISYYVIVADSSFTEKTFKNLKKMFGFNIKLKINNTENIRY